MIERTKIKAGDYLWYNLSSGMTVHAVVLEVEPLQFDNPEDRPEDRRVRVSYAVLNPVHGVMLEEAQPMAKFLYRERVEALASPRGERA